MKVACSCETLEFVCLGSWSQIPEDSDFIATAVSRHRGVDVDLFGVMASCGYIAGNLEMFTFSFQVKWLPHEICCYL
jgi:hypothetical protein